MLVPKSKDENRGEGKGQLAISRDLGEKNGLTKGQACVVRLSDLIQVPCLPRVPVPSLPGCDKYPPSPIT